MSSDAQPTLLERLVRRPFPILLGVAVGFLGCCIAGRVAARQQSFKHFVRFHQGVSPEAHFYPTYSQTLNIARQRVKPGKVLVIIAGDSVLHGVGQRPTHIWTNHLQKALGDDYTIVNFATRGGVPQEYGFPIAEQLHAEGVPFVVVFRGNIVDWDGYFNPYFFWDGWGKGYIQSDSRRDKWLAEYTTKNEKDPKKLEMKLRARIDSVTYAADLWTHFSYKYRASVWTPLRYTNFWRPYEETIDRDPGALIDWESRFNPSPDSQEVVALRHFLAFYRATRGQTNEQIGGLFKSFVPDSLLDRSIYVSRMENSYYRSRLTPEEQVEYKRAHFDLRDAIRSVGLWTEVVGDSYLPSDFVDSSHLSEQGGEKMAKELAPAIRQMSERLYGIKPTDAKGVTP